MISYLAVDIICVIFAYFLMNFKKSLTFYHPGTLLLFFHLIANTLRFIAVLNGANVSSPDMRGATEQELMRALFWADMALLVAAFAINIAERRPAKKANVRFYPLSNKILLGVIFFTIPIGFYGAVTQLYIPSIKGNVQDMGEWGASSYSSMIQPWFGLSFLALVYFKGFKKQYVIPLVIYLFIIAIQGFQRTRLVLPCIFLMVTYLYYNNLRWPRKTQWILLVGLAILFYPLKIISQVIQQGGSLTDISLIIRTAVGDVSSGNADDQVILDQYAVTLTEIDRNGKVYYGRTLAPLLVSPVPRLFWPEKPKLNQWQIDISSYYRPFNIIGSIATIYGEAYANFRYFGILFVPALLFYALTRWYKRIMHRGIRDIDKFFYTIIFCCMIQVMRDGLISLVIFPVLHNMPLFIIFLLHKMLIRPKKWVQATIPAGAVKLPAAV